MKKLKLNKKMKNTVSTPEYIRQRISDGAYTTLLSEMRREGPTGLIQIAEIHANEKLRESRIRAALIGTDQNLVVAIDTTTWKFGAYQVHAPDQELNYDQNAKHDENTDEPANDLDNNTHVQDVADFQIEMTNKAVEVSNNIIDGIKAETITSYEQVIDTVSDKNLEALVLAILGQSKKPILELETPQGRLVIGGHFDMPDVISSDILRLALCDVRKFNDDANGSGSIDVKVTEVRDDVEKSPFELFSEQQLSATFFTVNDARSKRLLYFAKYLGKNVLLRLQFKYTFATGRWNCLCVSIANEAELVALEQVPQGIFDAL